MKVRLGTVNAPTGAVVIELPDRQLARLGLTPGSHIVVTAGNRQVVATVSSSSQDAADVEIRLSPAVLRRLSLDSSTARRFTYRVRKTSRTALQLGPVIGVLMGHSRDELRQNRHGYRIYDTLWNIRNVGGLAYFFTLEDIDWSEGFVLGHVHIPDEVPGRTPPARIPLEAASFPFPDVIYRRRSIPLSIFERIRREMTPKIFNRSRAGHKFGQARALLLEADLAAHIPEVHALDSADVLDDMLDRHGAVFLKRKSLGAGKGVVRATRADDGGYVLTHRLSVAGNQERTSRVKTFQQLKNCLARITEYEWNDSSWLVQQAIVPARYNGRIFDFRVTVQKNGLGRWAVHGMYVRIAPTSGSVITRRGDYKNARPFLNEVRPDQGDALYSAVADLAVRSVVVLDRELGLLGDVGVDIMIDVDDKLWFIEANPGPGYLSIGPDDADYRRQVAAPITFASYLAGFPVDPDVGAGAAATDRKSGGASA